MKLTERPGARKAVEYVDENFKRLRIKYGSRYIAVMENLGVIDQDNDKATLHKRLERNLTTARDVVVGPISHIIRPEFPLINEAYVARFPGRPVEEITPLYEEAA